MSEDGNSVARRFQKIKSQVAVAAEKSGRRPQDVRIVAVSKLQPVDKVKELIEVGHGDFGENYVQEAEEKLRGLKGYHDLNWHFIGRVQSKKVKLIAQSFSWIHSVDRLKILEELHKHRSQNPPVNVLIQVNLAEEGSKAGVRVEDLSGFLEAAQKYEGFRIRGLMTMPPLSDDSESSRVFFSHLRELARDYETNLAPPHDLKELSMGTTSDFQVAVEEGATMVRIGRSLFGERTG